MANFQIFHTDNVKVWNYLSRFTEWEYYHHKVLAHIDGQKVHLPFNLNTIYQVFPPDKAKRIEKCLLENYTYNEKVPILKLRESKDKILNDLGILQRGLIIRHLVLPGHVENSIEVIEILKNYQDRGLNFKLSLMSQYFPAYKAVDHPEINRKLNP